MHYQVIMVVKLDKPIEIEPADSKDDRSVATGYVITIGANAPDIVTAVQQSHEVALRPKQADGSFVEYAGEVENVEASQIQKEQWDPFILENATNIDQPGVYYSTGLCFFNHADTDKKWWQFWK